MSGFDARKLRDGSISQSAMRLTPDIPEALQEIALGGPVRATVLAVYYPEEDDRTTGDWATVVDVRTLGEKQRYLAKVPVYPLVAGVFDEDIRTPRPASLDINQGVLATESNDPSGPLPSEASSTDADIVMLWFEEGDPKKPFVMPFGPPHPRRGNAPTKAEGRVRRIRHNGTIFEIDKDGNVMIDASAAKTDALAADGSQVANPSGGNITIKTNGTPGLLNLQEATDFLIKGTTFWTELQKVISELALWSKTATGLAPIGTGATMASKADAFLLTASSWLSSRTKTG